MSDYHLYTSVFCVHCGHTVSIPVYCHNRFCPVCSCHRNRLIRHKLSTFLSTCVLRKYDSYKFLTLTVRNDPDLKHQVTELIKAFRRLRQRSLWKKHVRGGACVIEVKTGEGGWHAHLHIVIESAFIPFEALLAEWKSVSTGSGVYIKKLHGSQVISYITKYLTKEQCTEAEQKRMTDILKGVRLFQPFGQWHAPIQAIKRLRFDCPECTYSSWAFGKLSAWIRNSTEERTVNKRISDGLPSMKPNRQGNLLPDSYLMTGCQQ